MLIRHACLSGQTVYERSGLDVSGFCKWFRFFMYVGIKVILLLYDHMKSKVEIKIYCFLLFVYIVRTN